MKRLLSILLFIPIVGFSQYTAIPDQNFEQALILLGYDDVIDGQVLTADISGVEELVLYNQNITDLTGIEDFSALTYLYCNGNLLTSLDLSLNTALTFLVCQNNQLISLDLSLNTALTYLYCFSNQLISLDVSGCTALTELYCYDNQLISLDVNGCTALTELVCYNNQLTCLNLKNGNNLNFEYLYTFDNPNLTCIEVDDADYSSTTWPFDAENFGFGVDHYFSNDCDYPDDCGGSSSSGPYTLIPDDNFEAYLEANNMGDGVANNDSVLTANISSVATLAIPSLNISDLTGIESFLSLQTLYCYQNSINTIDISNNLNLKNLICWNNQINSLNVSQNTALITLNCSGNLISTLDVSQNTLLDEIVCSNNQISSLDVSQNTLLKTLKFQDNQVSSIDVSSNVILEELNCDNNIISTLDVSINTALKKLDCSDNLISNLDVSQNPALNTLRCHSNLISQIDVSQNPALNIFICHSNVINSLDLSQNSGLGSFYAYLNQLSSLDVRNGNNSNVSAFVTWGNSSLTCISVDDVAYSTANWTDIDSHTSFSLNCGQDSANTTCDSIIYIYDTLTTNIYDTLTSYQTIYDTVTVDLVDTTYVTIEDTVTTFLYDTITTYDTSYVSIAVTDTLYIDITITGTIDITNTISIYPNPANEFVIIDNGNYSSMTNYELKIVNALGQEVFNSLINIPLFEIPISTIGAEGTYFVHVLDGDGNLVVTKYLILN